MLHHRLLQGVIVLSGLTVAMQVLAADVASRPLEADFGQAEYTSIVDHTLFLMAHTNGDWRWYGTDGNTVQEFSGSGDYGCTEATSGLYYYGSWLELQLHRSDGREVSQLTDVGVDDITSIDKRNATFATFGEKLSFFCKGPIGRGLYVTDGEAASIVDVLASEGDSFPLPMGYANANTFAADLVFTAFDSNLTHGVFCTDGSEISKLVSFGTPETSVLEVNDVLLSKTGGPLYRFDGEET